MFSAVLTPLNNLKLIKAESNSAHYISTGTDPHFNVTLTSPLKNGWYEIVIPIEKIKGTIKSPRLYFDTGNGYNETEIIELSSLKNNKITGIIAFPRTVTSLRFDPTIAASCEFKIKNIEFKKISQFKASLKLFNLLKQDKKTKNESLSYYLINLIKKDGISGIRKELRDIAYNIASVDSTYEEWIENYDSLSEEGTTEIKKQINNLKYTPLISIILPTYNTNKVWLEECIQSVLNQTYTNWELCIADDASTNEQVRRTISKSLKSDGRIKAVFRDKNGHISETSNSALKLAKGDYVTFLDHDDTLAPNALYWIVDALNKDKQLDFIYSDEDKINEQGERLLPFFKPDWSPFLLYSHNYICHLTCIRKSLVDSLGGFTVGMEGSQDYDLFLRAISKTTKIKHIPRILYHWRLHPLSTSSNSSSKPYAHNTGKKALEEHLQMKYGKLFRNVDDGDHFFTYTPRFNISKDTLVSIILPTKDKIEYLRPCISSILKKSTWKNFEIIILNNNSELEKTHTYFKQIQAEDSRVKVIDALFEFNWSKLNNFGVSHSKGNVLIFLNNDTTIITPGWIEKLAEMAILPDIAAVGALLLYEDNTIQHAGVVVGMNGWADHVFKGMHPVHYPSPFVSQVLSRNTLAITGACMAIERKKLNALGGFDEEFIICGSDVEICIRAFKKNLLTVLNTSVQLYHFESKSRGTFVPENDFIHSSLKYAPYRVEEVDPYFNPNLLLNSVVPVCKS